MVVGPPQRASTRGKVAASPRTDKYPGGIIALIFAIVDDDRRTRNAIRLLVCLMIGCCVVTYTVIAGTKGVHALTWRLLLPGGVFGGGTLTYAINRLKLRIRRRRDDAEAADAPTTGRSRDPSHTPDQQSGTPSKAQ
jgi:hypothetical protein